MTPREDTVTGRYHLGRTIYSRRQLLGGIGALGLGVAGLSGCEISTETDPGGSDSGSGGRKFNFENLPDSGAKLPKGEVTVGWMDTGDLKAMFEEPYFAAYQEKHPNITIDYQPSAWDTINETIPVAVRNKKAPDVYMLPQTVPVQVAVNDGWIKPIDDLIPNFEQWKSRFPEGSFINGVHIFDGRTYTWPMNSSKRYGQMLMIHPPYLREAGYDPVAEPLTWSTFREACKKITKNGNGQYYGLLTNADQLGDLATALAQLAGLRTVDGMDLRTGEYVYDAPELLEAFELLLAIKDDGSLFPGFMGLDDATSRARFPQQVAGMIFDGPWDIPEWPATNPEFEFDVAMPPSADGKEHSTVGFWETGANFMYVFAGTENDAVVGDMFHYLGGIDGQANIIVFAEGNLQSVIPDANELADKSKRLDDKAVKAIDIANRLMRVAPDPRVRNPEISSVILESDPELSESVRLTEIAEGAFGGDLDLKTELKKYADDRNKGLDAAIAAARKKGAQVSRDDYVFPNWDPSQDYTAADYDEL
jgi:multiple sugar transport system substrate-binding protein